MAEEASAVNQPVVADTTPTESAPVETKETASTDDANFDDGFDSEFGDKTESKPKTKDDPIDLEESEESKDDTPNDDTSKDTKSEEKQSDDEKPTNPKSENRFQKLANDNRALREEIETLKARQAQVAIEQELLDTINPDSDGQYYTPEEAERIAKYQANQQMQENLQQQQYQLEVNQSRMSLYEDTAKTLQNNPMFDPESKEFNEGLAAQADELLKANLITDQNGDIVGSRVAPSQIIKAISDSYNSALKMGEANALKAKNNMMASADTLGSSATEKPKTDPFMEAFDKEF